MINLNFTLFIDGIITTIIVTIISVFMGFLLGFILGFLNCNKLKHKYLSILINSYVTFFRGTPLYVQILIIYFAIPEITGLNLNAIPAGIIALGLNSTAYCAEIIRSNVNAIPEGQWQASYVLGYNLKQTIIYIITPQVFKNSLPTLTNEFANILKDTSILSTIGVVEITKIASNLSAKNLDPISSYLSVAIIYLTLTLSLTFISKNIERKLNHA